MEGTIYRSTGSWYEVKGSNNEFYRCRLKGVFKNKGLKVTNPICVGDMVVFDLESGNEEQGVIFEIKPRRNYIVRKSVHKREHAHLLASNIDYLVFIFTLDQPKTSLGFLDRFLVTAETFRIPVIILFNKIDIFDKDEKEIIDALCYLYSNLHYTCLKISATENKGLGAFKKAIKDKTVLIAGHSGVGKSTLLNQIDPDLDIATSDISDFSNKGVHTTTFAEMFDLKGETRVIDSPGIKELGIMEIGNHELGHFFPEFRQKLGECKFHNCMHLNEPKCAIKEAVEDLRIAPSRYASYLSILENHDNRR